MRARLALIFAVACTVAAGGCTVPSEGTPQPVSSALPPSGSGEDLPSDGAPRVEDPLDAARFEQEPCDVLTPADAETLNVPPTGEQSGDAYGQRCHWHNSDTGGSLFVTFFSGVDRGLSSFYEESRGSKWKYFERIDDIEGHPAVAYNIKEDPPKYDCSVAVGLIDELAFSAGVKLSNANVGHSDPCALAAKAAGMMTRTMQEAATHDS